MNLDFQAFHIQQHVMFHVLLFHCNFLIHLLHVPKFKTKKILFFKIQNRVILVHNQVHYDRDFLTLRIELKSIEMIDIEQETMMVHSKCWKMLTDTEIFF